MSNQPKEGASYSLSTPQDPSIVGHGTGSTDKGKKRKRLHDQQDVESARNPTSRGSSSKAARGDPAHETRVTDAKELLLCNVHGLHAARLHILAEGGADKPKICNLWRDLELAQKRVAGSTRTMKKNRIAMPLASSRMFLDVGDAVHPLRQFFGNLNYGDQAPDFRSLDSFAKYRIERTRGLQDLGLSEADALEQAVAHGNRATDRLATSERNAVKVHSARLRLLGTSGDVEGIMKAIKDVEKAMNTQTKFKSTETSIGSTSQPTEFDREYEKVDNAWFELKKPRAVFKKNYKIWSDAPEEEKEDKKKALEGCVSASSFYHISRRQVLETLGWSEDEVLSKADAYEDLSKGKRIRGFLDDDLEFPGGENHLSRFDINVDDLFSDDFFST
jgi:hypothetical protein